MNRERNGKEEKEKVKLRKDVVERRKYKKRKMKAR